MRLSFLVDADPNKLPYTFVSKLQALIEDRDSVTEMQLDRSIAFLDTVTEWNNLAAPITEIADFARCTWDAYLACIQDPQYHFSVSELIVIASGAQ